MTGNPTRPLPGSCPRLLEDATPRRAGVGQLDHGSNTEEKYSGDGVERTVQYACIPMRLEARAEASIRWSAVPMPRLEQKLLSTPPVVMAALLYCTVGQGGTMYMELGLAYKDV